MKRVKTITFAIAYLIIILVITGCSGSIESWIHEDVNEGFVNRTFSKQALVEDLKYLNEEMAARHPVFDELTDDKAISARFTSISDQLKDGMSRQDFFRLIGKLNPYFKDGHSIIFPLLAEAIVLINEMTYSAGIVAATNI